MTVELKPAGRVAVDSGHVAITDPCHLKYDAPASCIYTQKTTNGDGVFPVFTFCQDGIEYLAVQLASEEVTGLKRDCTKSSEQSN
jgi:hypothetical protein